MWSSTRRLYIQYSLDGCSAACDREAVILVVSEKQDFNFLIHWFNMRVKIWFDDRTELPSVFSSSPDPQCWHMQEVRIWLLMRTPICISGCLYFIIFNLQTNQNKTQAKDLVFSKPTVLILTTITALSWEITMMLSGPQVMSMFPHRLICWIFPPLVNSLLSLWNHPSQFSRTQGIILNINHTKSRHISFQNWGNKGKLLLEQLQFLSQLIVSALVSVYMTENYMQLMEINTIWNQLELCFLSLW